MSPCRLHRPRPALWTAYWDVLGDNCKMGLLQGELCPPHLTASHMTVSSSLLHQGHSNLQGFLSGRWLCSPAFPALALDWTKTFHP